MTRTQDILLTALAPAAWGASYIISSELLPGAPPVMVAALRALSAGALLLLVTRQVPRKDWIGRLLVLGVLNFALFFSMLFIAAYRLPGGVAATLGATQPLFVLFLAWLWLSTPLSLAAIGAAVTGLAGVGLLILGPNAVFDWIGIAAALAGAVSMAAGTVLARRWQLPVAPLTFAAWQLLAGGLVLLPIALLVDPRLPVLDTRGVLGLLWLGTFGGALAYWAFFRGIRRLGPAAVAGLGFLSPLSAVLLGWGILGQALTPMQMLGAALVLGSVWAGQRANRPAQPARSRNAALNSARV
ncbi:EamA family transporter [Pacificoceanicola onchidii]|uniref:EamA family transporter n=1 Tax=Pacificoceanicola onchidii TaxID=2562685 RepID=UPI0010A6A3A8|nr:EamA family transporter [Pacificoceanicola onchidii]